MNIYKWIYSATGITPDFQQKLVYSVVLVLLVQLILKILNRLLQKIRDSVARYELNKVGTGLIIFTAMLALGRVWFQWFESLIVFTAVIIGAILIALKEVLFDLAGWVHLVWWRPFEAGDWIVLGEVTGEVVEIKPLQFILLETGGWEEGRLRSGRIIHVPNGKIFREQLINYSKGYNHVWNEFKVQLTSDSNWEKAKEILRRVVNRYTEPINWNDCQIRQVAQKCTVFVNKMAPEIYTQVVDGRIVLTTRFLCEPDKRRITLHAIWEELLNEFKQAADLQFADSKIIISPSGAYSDPVAAKVATTSELD